MKKESKKPSKSVNNSNSKLKEVFNSDSKKYNGTGDFSNKPFSTITEPQHFRDFSAEITIPPLGMIAFKYTNITKRPVSKKKLKEKKLNMMV